MLKRTTRHTGIYSWTEMMEIQHFHHHYEHPVTFRKGNKVLCSLHYEMSPWPDNIYIIICLTTSSEWGVSGPLDGSTPEAVILHLSHVAPRQILCELRHVILWCHQVTDTGPGHLKPRSLKVSHLLDRFNSLGYLGTAPEKKIKVEFHIPRWPVCNVSAKKSLQRCIHGRHVQWSWDFLSGIQWNSLHRF